MTDNLALERAWRAAVGWEPHRLQKEILENRTRHQVVAAGRRFGKSQLGGHKLVPYAFSAFAEQRQLIATGKQRRYWIVGPEYSDAEKEFRVLWDVLKRLGVEFDRPGSYNNPHMGDMHISLWDGLFKVDALSAKHPETLVGEGVSGIVISEAAKLKPSVYPKFLRPTLADFGGWTFASSTPEGRNWFYRLWQDGQDSTRPDWKSWRAPSWANPHVYRNMQVFGREADGVVKAVRSLVSKRIVPEQIPITSGLARFVSDTAWESLQYKSWQAVATLYGVDPEIMSLMLDLSAELFDQEVGANFNEFVGRVFKDFDEEIHVGDLEYDPSWATYAALDYGFSNPFVWLLIQVDPHGTNIRILDEYYETGKTTEEACQEIKARGLAPGSLREFFPDPAEPDRSVTVANVLQIRSRSGTGGLISDRLEWIRRKLRPAAAVAHLDMDHAEWVPQLMINRRCKDTIRDMNSYRYPKTFQEATSAGQQAPENPRKVDDHAPEALGRFMVGMYGSPWRTQAPARQSTSRVGRRPRGR